MGVQLRNPAQGIKRWIFPENVGVATTSGSSAAGRVVVCAFKVEYGLTVSGVQFINVATVAGNITVGIYGPLVTEDICDGSPLIASSTSTAAAGANQSQYIAFSSNVYLQPGRYYVAIEASDATHTFGRVTINNLIAGYAGSYDRGGGYGALTNPCPAVTPSQTNYPCFAIRCV